MEDVDLVSTELKALSQPITSRELSNAPRSGRANVQPPSKSTANLVPRYLLWRCGHAENVLQTRLCAGAVEHELLSVRPEKTVQWPNKGDAIPPLREKCVLAQLPRPREEQGTTDHSTNEFEQGSLPRSGRELQREKLASVLPKFVITTPEVTATSPPAIAEPVCSRSDPNFQLTPHNLSERNEVGVR